MKLLFSAFVVVFALWATEFTVQTQKTPATLVEACKMVDKTHEKSVLCITCKQIMKHHPSDFKNACLDYQKKSNGNTVDWAQYVKSSKLANKLSKACVTKPAPKKKDECTGICQDVVKTHMENGFAGLFAVASTALEKNCDPTEVDHQICDKWWCNGS